MNERNERLYSYFLVAMLLASLYMALLVLKPFLNIIIIGVVLSSLCYPLYTALRSRFNGHDSLAALATVAIIVLCVMIPLFFFFSALISQAAKSIISFQAWITTFNLDQLKHEEFIKVPMHFIEERLPFIHFNKFNIQSELLELTRKYGQTLLDSGTVVLSNMANILMKTVILIFTLFFFFKDGEKMLSQLRHLTPLHASQEDRIIAKLNDVARSVVLGSFVIALLQGLAGGIGLALVGIPALFWGSMMGFASFIPVVGTAIIWGPCAAYLLLTGDWKSGVFLIVWGMLVISSIDSFLRPYFMKGQSQMSVFYVFLAIIGGLQLFGALGLLYGPLVLSLAMVMLSIYSEEYGDFLNDKG